VALISTFYLGGSTKFRGSLRARRGGGTAPVDDRALFTAVVVVV